MGRTPPQPPSRFAAFGRVRVLILLAVIALLSLSALVTAPPALPPKDDAPQPISAPAPNADIHLYQGVIAAMRHGAPYYPTVAAMQRASDYPLKPFVTVRLPTLAWILSALPGDGAARALLIALIALTCAAWGWRFRAEGVTTDRITLGVMLVLAGTATLLRDKMLPVHDGWAGLLIALSLALWSPKRWWLAAIMALLAATVREHAILYAAVMGAFALVQRRRREALGWLGVGIAFAALLTLHAQAVAAVTLPGDPTSPGWTSLTGWRMSITMLQESGPLRALPFALAMAIVSLALIGWAGRRSETGARATAILLTFAGLFAVFGRAENFYWGFNVAPLLLIGLNFAPAALRDVWRAGIRAR